MTQTGTKPKKKLKKKKKQIQEQTEELSDLDDEFLLSASGSNSHMQSSQKQTPMKNVMALEQKSLNPDNELKKIFGSKIVTSTQKKKARGRAYVKSTWLINAKDNWSQIKKTGSLLSISLNCLTLTQI